ncbi:MAG: dienelactone hydrolase family protein, partial [Candidatus Marinimicrobia bacterium]|nr:dienelactone hydrolase family protein [Candidatus Neomarinimicrobiota bacterium]
MKLIYSISIILSILLYLPSNSTAQEKPTDGDLPPAVLGTASSLRGESVNYFSEDPKTAGYIVAPDTEGKKPALIIVHEWYGLKLRIKEMADALADEGYVVLAVDMYSGKTGSNNAENRALMTESLSDP